tara:strand:- start:6322 stop:7098 length:777 start_codon:yes stop_codon:yes gene_type:complete
MGAGITQLYEDEIKLFVYSEYEILGILLFPGGYDPIYRTKLKAKINCLSFDGTMAKMFATTSQSAYFVNFSLQQRIVLPSGPHRQYDISDVWDFGPKTHTPVTWTQGCQQVLIDNYLYEFNECSRVLSVINIKENMTKSELGDYDSSPLIKQQGDQLLVGYKYNAGFFVDVYRHGEYQVSHPVESSGLQQLDDVSVGKDSLCLLDSQLCKIVVQYFGPSFPSCYHVPSGGVILGVCHSAGSIYYLFEHGSHASVKKLT